MELNETSVEAFMAKFKASDNDKRVDQVQLFGVQLEATPSLPDSTLDGITLLLCPTLRSTNHLLIQSTLTSALPVFIPHLPTDHAPHLHLRLALVQFLPPLLEKLNDPKEKIAAPARTSIELLGKKCFEAEAGQPKEAASAKGKEKEGLVAMWERQVKDAALAGKGWRGKSEGMKLIVSLRLELGNKMSLRPWLATLVELLEDGDSNVRETARETLVALLSPASTSPGARTELKKLLQARHIRASIADNIITRIFSAKSAAATPASEVPPSLEDGSGSGGRSGAATPASDDVSVVYIASARDLEGEFAQMLPYFQGKEDEHNWNPRERSIVRVRGMLRGQAFQQYPDAFIGGLKAGFFGGLSRTQSCALMQELAEHLGSALDPFVENLLPILAKMAGYTKKIIADKSQRALTAILLNSSAHPRLFVNHIHAGIQDKNVQTRHFSITHLKTFLDSQAVKTKQTIEHTPGLLDQLCDSVKKALADVNPGVREVGRPAYWSLHAIWPARSTPLAEQLDAAQKKLLDKVRPGHTAPIPATRPPIGAAKKSSGIGALLAEKRKAAMAARRDSQRTVSSPVPASPSLAQTRTMPRATSSQHPTQADEEAEAGKDDDAPAPVGTPTREAVATKQLAPTPSSIAAGGTSPVQSPLRQQDRTPSKEPKSSSSSSTSSNRPLQTPEVNQCDTRQTLEVNHDDGPLNPVTPMRPTRSAAQEMLYRTPVNGLGKNVWEDSPGPSTVTPLMMDKLKGRRYERSWWLKRQQYLDKASPLRTNAPTPASAIEADISALESGSPELRNLQKLTLFSTSRPIDGEGDKSEHEATWTTGRLFDRVFDSLVAFLRPAHEADLLEHGLVLLWELVQHQWTMVEDKESMLVDALFALRSTKNATILESTNSLISLLAEISDPVYLLGLLRSSLDRHVATAQQTNGSANGHQNSIDKTQASGYLLGLNGMGMCILRLPPPVVEIEAPKLTAAIMSAVADPSPAMLPARQAVHHLLLCIQCVLKDARRTLALFPNLPEAQQNLAMYLMEQNGLLPGGVGSPEKVMHEMAGLMSRGTA